MTGGPQSEPCPDAESHSAHGQAGPPVDLMLVDKLNAAAVSPEGFDMETLLATAAIEYSRAATDRTELTQALIDTTVELDYAMQHSVTTHDAKRHCSTVDGECPDCRAIQTCVEARGNARSLLTRIGVQL